MAVRTVDDILLLPEGYTGGVPDTATIFKPNGVDGATGADEYDLLFDTLEGDFIMGEREKLSLPGILSIRAGGTGATAQIGDLSGLEIYVDADKSNSCGDTPVGYSTPPALWAPIPASTMSPTSSNSTATSQMLEAETNRSSGCPTLLSSRHSSTIRTCIPPRL